MNYVYYRTMDPIAMPKQLLRDVKGRAARANGPGDEPTAAGCPMRGNSGWRMALRHCAWQGFCVLCCYPITLSFSLIY